MHICVAVGPIIIIYTRARARVYCRQRVGVDTVLYYYMPFAAGVHYNISIGIPIYIYVYNGRRIAANYTARRSHAILATHTHTHT